MVKPEPSAKPVWGLAASNAEHPRSGDDRTRGQPGRVHQALPAPSKRSNHLQLEQLRSVAAVQGVK